MCIYILVLVNWQIKINKNGLSPSNCFLFFVFFCFSKTCRTWLVEWFFWKPDCCLNKLLNLMKEEYSHIHMGWWNKFLGRPFWFKEIHILKGVLNCYEKMASFEIPIEKIWMMLLIWTSWIHSVKAFSLLNLIWMELGAFILKLASRYIFVVILFVLRKYYPVKSNTKSNSKKQDIAFCNSHMWFKRYISVDALLWDIDLNNSEQRKFLFRKRALLVNQKFQQRKYMVLAN